MNDAILHHIGQLPPLPESVVQIENIYRDPDATFNDMAKIVQKDPLLTADILKAANSPLYGFSREINSMSQAVSLFGMGTIRGFALASIVKKSFPLDLGAYGLSNEQFSNLSEMLSGIAVSWYVRSDARLLETLAPAAFLVEIGKVLISQFVLKENLVEAFLKTIEEEGVDAAEQLVVHTTTVEVSGALFEHWKFEADLIDAIKNCETPSQANKKNQKAAQSLHVMRTIVGLDCKITEQKLQKAKALIAAYGLDEKGFERTLDQIRGAK